MPKTDVCPVCFAVLKPTKSTKMVCPTAGCTFVDRRCGSSMVDPLADRREGINSRIIKAKAYDHLEDAWGADRRWSKV